MCFQITAALLQRLGMGAHQLKIRKGNAGKSHQHVIRPDNLLSHDVVLIFHQQIIDIRHDPRRGVFYGEDGVIRLSLRYGLHGVLPGFHMKTVHFRTEIGVHGREAVSPFHPWNTTLASFVGRRSTL